MENNVYGDFMRLIILAVILLSNMYGNNQITIGTIDSEPKEKIYKFQPLADYLQKKLQKKNIKVNLEIPKDINTAVQLINNKKLDIYIDSVYPSLLVQKDADITIVCKRWKKGKEGYKSLIFTRKDSNIDKISDLKGKTIAFEDKYSTSGYYIPKKEILNQGLNLSHLGKSDSINYIFSKSEENSIAWVMFGKADAAVLDDKTFKSLDQNLFKVIYKSKLIPRHLVSFSKNINKELKTEILNILYDMDKDKDGIEVLKKFSKTKKFSPLTIEDEKMIKDL